jgi:hypothetical protein
MAKQNKSVLDQIKDKKYIIDIKKVKECYKANNPDKKPLTNIQLAEITGKTPQYFSDLQSPKKSKPDLTLVLIKLSEVSGMNIQDFVNYVE